MTITIYQKKSDNYSHLKRICVIFKPRGKTTSSDWAPCTEKKNNHQLSTSSLSSFLSPSRVSVFFFLGVHYTYLGFLFGKSSRVSSMANRTDPMAKSIRGTNPQNLVEKILRSKIYQHTYWKEQCFGLTAETLVDKAMELDHLGGTYGGSRKPTPFMCLITKMLQIQPEKDIVVEFIKNEDYKYDFALPLSMYLSSLYCVCLDSKWGHGRLKLYFREGDAETWVFMCLLVFWFKY